MMYTRRQGTGNLSKKRIEEIANYILYNFYETISGEDISELGINLDLTNEDDEYISDIREDVEAFNAVLRQIRKIKEEKPSMRQKFMNVIRPPDVTFHRMPITAFKIKGVYEIPTELYNFTNLKILQLTDGDMDEFPENINNFSNLVELNITNLPNIYNFLPNTFSGLNNLRTLEISGTSISQIPEDIVELPQLKTFILKNNPHLTEFPDSLIEKNKLVRDFKIKTEYSPFYKDKMFLENVSENEKSTLILGIISHGSDLCDVTLDINPNKLLYFSHAPKYGEAIPNVECPTKVQFYDLMKELNENKNRISDVIEKMENVDSDVYKIRDAFSNNVELNEKKTKLLKSYRTALLENQANLVYKVRDMTNDHHYNFDEDPMEEYEGKFGIYILDIRNPKNKKQNDYISIVKDLNSKKTITLSEILNICYDLYDFNYVAIIDSSCRVSSIGRPECNLENIYKIRSKQVGEISRGRNPLMEFKRERLGGKSKKKFYKNKKNNKKSLKSLKSLKKRNPKKTRKNKK
jgi:hypothetical protein